MQDKYHKVEYENENARQTERSFTFSHIQLMIHISVHFTVAVELWCDVMHTGWGWPGKIWSDAEGVTAGQSGVDGVL